MAGLPEGINDHGMNLPNLSCGGFLAISCRLGSLPARRCCLRLHRLLGSRLSQTPNIASTLPADRLFGFAVVPSKCAVDNALRYNRLQNGVASNVVCK